MSMNELSDNTPTQPKAEHGTLASYVIGFILSLVFTAIPYYLVVNKTVTGNVLLATILAFAVLQMAVQIFFFLHLGRGPKPLYNVAFFVSTVGIILVVVLGSMFIMDHLSYNMMASKATTTKLAQDEGISQVGGEKTGACADIGVNYQLVIRNGLASPLRTEAHLCDSLTFINQDSAVHEIVFGSYPHSEDYGGETGLNVRNGHPKTITLNQLGTHSYYDHLHPTTAGYFVVTQNSGAY
jgi:cytochrome o ubiquinol oxidase operon protein cyoD